MNWNFRTKHLNIILVPKVKKMCQFSFDKPITTVTNSSPKIVFPTKVKVFWSSFDLRVELKEEVKRRKKVWPQQ